MTEERIIIALALEGKGVADFCAATGRTQCYMRTKLRAMELRYDTHACPKRWRVPAELMPPMPIKDRGALPVKEALALGYQIAGIPDPIHNPYGIKISATEADNRRKMSKL
jgi:hypothetical protein